MKIAVNRTPAFFYLGTLISSVGNMTLSVSLIAFMLKGGFSLLQVGTIVGLSRFLPLLVSVLLGHRLDGLSPRKLILWAELGAGASSLLLLLEWTYLGQSFPVLLAAMVFRAFFTSIQTGSRAQMAKILSDSSYQSNSRNAAWLNKVTQGATLFGGGLSWLAIQFSTLPVVIIFDALTFIVNGVILGLLPVDHQGQRKVEAAPIFKKFRDLYQFNFRAASLDAFLALSAMGTSAFTARLAGAHEEWISLFVISYGLSVWIAGYLERLSFVQKKRTLIWCLLSASFALLGIIPGPGAVVWITCLVKDTCFWILFHRITAHIQVDTPKEILGSVTFARNAQLVTILALGEMLVGLWKNAVPFPVECGVRAGIAIAVAIIIAVKSAPVGNHEKARL